MFISSDRLLVEITEPGTPPNDTDRFDRAGLVTEVILDGRHRFMASEPDNLPHPSSGGRGLGCEYAFDISAETPVGGAFPKFGVGVLVKPDDRPYCIYKKYRQTPFPQHWQAQADSVVFSTTAIPCQGYALESEKTLRVSGATLRMNVKVKNVGEKTIVMKESCHNFLTIDSMALGPDYRVSLPGLTDRGSGPVGGTAIGAGLGYSFSKYAPEPCSINVDPADILPGDEFRWELTNKAARAAVAVTEKLKVSTFKMWCADHIVSPMSYQSISLKPGETAAWERSWTFLALD